jgi:hypothetical protein
MTENSRRFPHNLSKHILNITENGLFYSGKEFFYFFELITCMIKFSRIFGFQK